MNQSRGIASACFNYSEKGLFLVFLVQLQKKSLCPVSDNSTDRQNN